MSADESTALGLPNLPLEERWRHQRHPVPIVVALIKRRQDEKNAANPTEQYLLIKRNGQPYNGRWALVGGKWDFGETLPDAIIREVKEETTLATGFVAVRGVVNERVIPSGDRAYGAHFLIFVCELAVLDGNAREQGEGAVSWFTWPGIEGLHAAEAIIPSDFAMISSFAGAKETVPHVEAEMRAALSGSEEGSIYLLRYDPLPKTPNFT